MKLMTLNTHSLVEADYPCKLKSFVSAAAEELPDIIALQEVNQSISSEEAAAAGLQNFTPCGSTPVKADNHAYNAVKMLSEKGAGYYWTWLGIKEGYGKYDEGISLLSQSPIIETDTVTVSSTDDYRSWKTRRVIGVRTQNHPDTWFYSVHLGWWEDNEEPFSKQWERLNNHIRNKGRVWLMGDFNSPADKRDEGYDLIKESGFYDSFLLAKRRDSGVTAVGKIDGWTESNEMRIDYIWCSEKADVISSSVIFNGKKYPVISDHYGVIIETKD